MLPNQRPFRNALPPAEVRFREVHVEPWPVPQERGGDTCTAPDAVRCKRTPGGRVRVHVSLAPFQQPPSIEAIITTPDGEEAASANIVETMAVKMAFTMHLRLADPTRTFHLSLRLYYPELESVDRAELDFVMPAPADRSGSS